MTAPHRVVIVGGGVLGLSAAARIAESGRHVTVLADESSMTVTSTATSAASFAWVNALAAGDPAYAAFKAAARDQHIQQGSGTWFVQTGSDADGALSHEDGYVDVERFAAAHRDRLLAAGGAVRTGVRVQRLGRRSGAVLVDCTVFIDCTPLVEGTASDAAPEVLTADTVIIAAGTGTADLIRTLSGDTRRIGTATGPRGFLARVRVDHALTSIRSIGGLQLRPDGPGILAAQSLTLERSLRENGQCAASETAWEPLRREISTALEHEVPPAALMSIDEAARPMSADGKPVVGWVAEGVYALLSHSGITLAPLLAHLVAHDLAGEDDAQLAPYRPESLIG